MASEPEPAIDPEDAAPAQAAALDASPVEPVAEPANQGGGTSADAGKVIMVTAGPGPSAAPLDELNAAALAARENNDTTRLMDAANREWFVGTANVDNRSTVLIQVRRGEAIREAYLSTATFTPETASAAILELDGALP